ncbi:MAG: patatin-like phospholipase family protein [Nannocystaceae bacterium]
MAKYTRVLSIDGGGIRGIIPGQVLRILEGKLEQRKPGARLADYFDLIAGTSTGGILACIYLCPDENRSGRPRFTAAEAVQLYLENGDEIFEIPLLHRARSLGGLRDERYPAEAIEELLERYFGDLRLKELLRPCLITAYDIKNRRTVFFNQSKARKKAGDDFLVREVARATSAAPTFFECARVTSASRVRYPMVDGGVFANNPTLCAYAEARKFADRPTAKQMLILSLGTGEQQRPYYYSQAKNWGAAEWIGPVLDIMMSGVAQTVDYQLRQIYDAVESTGQYLRLQANLPERNADMDNADRENVQELAEIGTRLAEKSDEQLDAFVELLLV